jgi:hypothetical protein
LSFRLLPLLEEDLQDLLIEHLIFGYVRSFDALFRAHFLNVVTPPAADLPTDILAFILKLLVLPVDLKILVLVLFVGL